MPVEKKPTGGDPDNAMTQALKKAGVELPSNSQSKPVEPKASSASAEPAPKPTEAPKPQPQVRPQPAQQREAVVEPKPQVNKDTATMTPGTNDFTGDRRQGQAQFTTLNEMGTRRIRPLSRSAGSVRAKELEAAILKELNSSLAKDGVSEWAVQVLDAGQLSLPTSAVLLMQTVKSEGTDYISAYSILMNGPDIRLPNRIDKVDGRPYETPTVVGDIYNSTEYITRATELVKIARPNKNIQLIDAGCTVLPSEFNIEQQGIHGLLYKATLAMYNTMNNVVELDSTPAYTLVGRNSSAEQLVGRLTFTGEKYLDEVGHPQRHDVVIEMDSTRHQAGREFLASNSNITKVSGYVEPVYAQPNPDPSQAMNNQLFYAQYVMTQLSTGYDAMDVEMTLLGLVTASMLQVQNGWADAFRPRYGSQSKEVDFRDVGGLGYCGPDAAKIDSKSENFKTNFPQFMRDYFRLNQGIIFAIDIAECGPDAFVMDIFRAAGGNNGNAITALVKAADNLTGGLFTQKANQAGSFPLIVDTGNRIHNGYYVAESGELRDIRDVDLLAVANVYGKSNPTAIMTYADSFSPNVAAQPIRMANRLQIIDDVLNGRQVITGYSGRYIIHPTFLRILTEACREVGLVVNPANMVHGLGSGSVLGGYDYGAFAAGQTGNSVFGGGSASGSQQAFTGRGRW